MDLVDIKKGITIWVGGKKYTGKAPAAFVKEKYKLSKPPVKVEKKVEAKKAKKAK